MNDYPERGASHPLGCYPSTEGWEINGSCQLDHPAYPDNNLYDAARDWLREQRTTLTPWQEHLLKLLFLTGPDGTFWDKRNEFPTR